jgi:hypothetical protein
MIAAMQYNNAACLHHNQLTHGGSPPMTLEIFRLLTLPPFGSAPRAESSFLR